jgi:hypothetical protein
MEILRGNNIPLVDEHYYFFYSTGQLWPVRFSDPEHSLWLNKRNIALSNLIKGNSEPTPGPFECRICPHNRKCSWKHIPKKRVEAAIKINHTGSRTRSLD